MAGFLGFSEVGEYDTGGGMTAFDKIDGGGFDYNGGEIQYDSGAGGQSAKWRGMVTPTGNLITRVQTLPMIAAAKPAAMGTLPTEIDNIQGGALNDVTAARIQSHVYIDSLELTCPEEEILQATYNWMALDEIPVVIAAAAGHQTNSHIAWHTAATEWSIDGGALGVAKTINWTARIENNMTPQTSQDAKAPGVEREPEWFDMGDVVISIVADVRVPLGIDFTADIVSYLGFKWTAQDNELAPKTFTLDMTGGDGLDPTPDTVPIVESAEAVLWHIEARSAPNDLATWVPTFA